MESFFLGVFYFGAIFMTITAVMGAVTGHGGGDTGHALHSGDTGPLTLKAADVDMPVLKSADAPVLKALHPLLPFLNTTTIVAFMTWFGGAGYVATHWGHWPWFLALIPAIAAGVAGGGVVAAFLGWLRRGSTSMQAHDFTLQGTLARVTVEIPANGVGEIVFTMAGAKRSEAAKGLANRSLPQGSEVVITGYERGIATVEPFKELMDGSSERERTGAVEAPRMIEED